MIFEPTRSLLTSLTGVAAISNGVGFEKTGHRLIPLIGLNGDAFFDERAGFGGGTSVLFELLTLWCREAVDSCGRNVEELSSQ